MATNLRREEETGPRFVVYLCDINDDPCRIEDLLVLLTIDIESLCELGGGLIAMALLLKPLGRRMAQPGIERVLRYGQGHP